MKKFIQILAVCLWMSSTGMWAQQTLPTSGEYYVIKNLTSGTYIGGTGSGNNAVKHENAATNADYHVFLVTKEDATERYKFQQQYTGRYIRHSDDGARDWTGEYDWATNDYRNLFFIDNATSSDYCIIIKSTNDEGQATKNGNPAGIGYDDAASGGILYMDKWTDKENKWLFDANEAKIILLARLQAVIDEVAIPSGVSADLDNAINAGEAIDSDATNAEIVAAMDAIKTASTAAYKDWAESELPASGGDYYLKVGGYYISLYDTPSNNAATTVALGALTENINIADASQIFNIAKLSGMDHTTPISRYAVFSRKNMGWHIADNGRFRNDWGNADNDWRTVNFLYDGTKYAWQFAGSSASKGFLKMKSATELEYDNSTALDADDFVFDIIPVFDVFSEAIVDGRAAYSAQLSNIGTAQGQYMQEVMDAFDAALDAAETKTSATFVNQDLFDYAADLDLFVANNATTISQSLKYNTSIIGANNAIRITADDAKVSIYSVTGKSILETVVSGVKTVPVAPGLYLVKTDGQITKVIVR